MTGTWDPILPSSLPSFVPCRFTLPLPPLSTPCYYLHPWPLLPTRLAQPLARLDTSLVSPLSFSFPSCRDPPPRIYPIYDHLFSASLFPSRCLPMRTSPPCTLLSKYYFSSATNAKLKRISPYSLCKYAGIATRVASFSFVSPPPSRRSLSFSLSPPSTFAILLTIICIQYSANGYGDVVRLQLGRRVVLLFRERLLVNSGADAPAHISRLCKNMLVQKAAIR